MANDLSNILHKILARGLMSVREQVKFTQLVNTDYSREAAQKGNTIDVPIPTSVGVIDVTPGSTDPNTVGKTPGKVGIELDNWKQSEPFALTDKELQEVDENEHFTPMYIEEAVRGIVGAINQSVISNYKRIYGFAGSAGSTPFDSEASAATSARKVLQRQLAPRRDRRMVLDHDAEANALGLSTFADFEKTGDRDVKIEGMLGRKYGFDWFSDDDIVTHTAGTAAGAGVTVTHISDSAAGAESVTLAVDSGTETLVEGDIISFAGHDQTYVVLEDVTLNTSGVSVSISPGLAQGVDGSNTAVAVTVRESHVVNLAFHRDAFALAMRPLIESRITGDGANLATIADPVSGLVLRAEVRRQHKQTAWEIDALWGAQLVRPEFAVRVAG